MDDRTLTALKGSIANWQLRAELGADYDGPTDSDGCPLCQLFICRTSNCTGCPVMERTNQPHCRGTPYYAWRDASWAAKDPFPEDGEEAARERVTRHAQAELDFLKSLLPEGVAE